MSLEWDQSLAETEALAQISLNIKENGSEMSHDPYCSPCPYNGTFDCPRRCAVARIDPGDLRPWEDYLDIKSRMNKKKILNSGYSKKTGIPSIPKNYFFITINPHSQIQLASFVPKIKKTLTSSMFTDYLAVFEQRGTLADNNIGKGFHAHILFKRKTPLNEGLPPSNIEAKIRKSYKNFVGCSTSNALINFQTIDERHALEKAKYMLGPKWENKVDKQVADYQWTKSHDLSPHYINLPFVDYLCKLDPSFFDEYL